MVAQAAQAEELSDSLVNLKGELRRQMVAEGVSPASAVEGDRSGRASNDDSGWTMVEQDDAMSAHLRQVRAKHAALVAQREELLRLSAESQLLLRDNEVLQMQLNVAVSMYSSAVSAAAPAAAQGGSGVQGSDATAESDAPASSGEGAAGAAAREPPNGEPAVASAPPATASGPSALEAVFQRMRVLESENLKLQAHCEELECETDSLKAALDASLSRLDAFKGLAATVGMIRGKKQSMSSANVVAIS